MQFSIVAVLLGLSAFAAATPMPQNGGRPVANGQCCVPNTSLKQDACNSPNGPGRCVPGGGGANCNGALDCVAQSNLVCDNNVQERGNTLCRAKTGNGGIIDGTKIIQNLGQAKVN
ncbi:hypothetical protein GRF29_8g3056270 [Pseudopithomyces chartarum]|uniref:Uncharacterized protein n=1 Tax=Pseudopithomyces chartarum TaxID=1892770 RepID=A0AAN6RMR5_9PLEO|nr:hypothetical protein GRF29_8g3056270 [Pseudopithomyces chartarum]